MLRIYKVLLATILLCWGPCTRKVLGLLLMGVSTNQLLMIGAVSNLQLSGIAVILETLNPSEISE